MSVTHHINQRHFQDRHINYYDVLGVKRHADIKEVKVAYFKMAKRFHPDFNKTLDSKQMFELVAEAYEVLSDEDRRAEYDETGCVSSRHGGRSAQGPSRQSTDSRYTAEQMYSKIFNSDEEFQDQQEYPSQDYANSTRSNIFLLYFYKTIF
jgi:DnaJ-class molecular chaperone